MLADQQRCFEEERDGELHMSRLKQRIFSGSAGLCMVVVCLGFCVCGSHQDGSGDLKSSKRDMNKAKSFGMEFGQKLLSNDFDGAYGMLSSQARKANSVSSLSASFRMTASGLAAHHVDIGVGGLPMDAEDAVRNYGIPADIPFELLRGWMHVKFLSEDEKLGFDVPVMVIEEDGNLKIGFMEFGYTE